MAMKSRKNERILPWRDEVLGIDAQDGRVLSWDKSYLLIEFFLLLLQLLLSELVSFPLLLLFLSQHLFILLSDQSVLPGLLDVAIRRQDNILGLARRGSRAGKGKGRFIDGGASWGFGESSGHLNS